MEFKTFKIPYELKVTLSREEKEERFKKAQSIAYAPSTTQEYLKYPRTVLPTFP